MCVCAHAYAMLQMKRVSTCQVTRIRGECRKVSLSVAIIIPIISALQICYRILSRNTRYKKLAAYIHCRITLNYPLINIQIPARPSADRQAHFANQFRPIPVRDSRRQVTRGYASYVLRDPPSALYRRGCAIRERGTEDEISFNSSANTGGSVPRSPTS